MEYWIVPRLKMQSIHLMRIVIKTLLTISCITSLSEVAQATKWSTTKLFSFLIPPSSRQIALERAVREDQRVHPLIRSNSVINLIPNRLWFNKKTKQKSVTMKMMTTTTTMMTLFSRTISKKINNNRSHRPSLQLSRKIAMMKMTLRMIMGTILVLPKCSLKSKLKIMTTMSIGKSLKKKRVMKKRPWSM